MGLPRKPQEPLEAALKSCSRKAFPEHVSSGSHPLETAAAVVAAAAVVVVVVVVVFVVVVVVVVVVFVVGSPGMRARAETRVAFLALLGVRLDPARKTDAFGARA